MGKLERVLGLYIKWGLSLSLSRLEVVGDFLYIIFGRQTEKGCEKDGLVESVRLASRRASVRFRSSLSILAKVSCLLRTLSACDFVRHNFFVCYFVVVSETLRWLSSLHILYRSH